MQARTFSCRLFVALSVAVQGCIQPVTQAPQPSLPTQPTQPITTAGPSTSATVLHLFQPGQLIYDFTITSIIESLAGDSLPRTDSTQATATLSITFARLSEQLIRANVRTDSIRLVDATGAVTSAASTIQGYTIESTPNGRVRYQRPVRSTCTSEQPTFLNGDDILPAFPFTTPTPKMWVDTARYELCRGGVLLHVVRISEYRADESTSGEDSLRKFIRTTVAAAKGRGVQWLQPVEANGTGTATDTLVIRHSRLTTISGGAQSEFSFQSEFRKQQFRQRSYIRLQVR